jgi:hypothetical protein
MAPVKQQDSSNRGGPFSSLDVLSGKPETPGNASADALTAGPAGKQPAKYKGTALVRWGNTEFKCMIKAISIDEVLLVSKRGENHPGIFEKTSLTLSPGNQTNMSITGINAYVHSIAALEKREDADFFQMLLRYSNLNAEQRGQLTSFIVDNP